MRTLDMLKVEAVNGGGYWDKLFKFAGDAIGGFLVAKAFDAVVDGFTSNAGGGEGATRPAESRSTG